MATIQGAADSSDRAAANIVQLPFSQARYLIAETRRDCELLRRSISTVVGCLSDLSGVIENIDDGCAREMLQSQVARVNKLLLLRLNQLSVADRLFQEMLRQT